jgi:monoamine oxidase
MLDVAIVGGGLCGLALAHAVNEQTSRYALFEARGRLGGRILSVSTGDDGPRLDLGPTWFWPQSNPLLVRLIEELGLDSFEQHDRGTVLSLEDPEKSPVTAQIDGVHGGARRVEGGMAGLTDALAARLPRDRLNVNHALAAVLDRGGYVELQFRFGDEMIVVMARCVVLAIPPRIIAEQVHFEPRLNEEARAALAAAPTWMASQAKAVISYEQAAWRAAGQSGNAFVRHEQAAFREIFDACDVTGAAAALGGFVALPPQLRRDFRVGLPMLMSNQMTQVFGTELRERAQTFQDWADEPYTCSSRDWNDFNTNEAHASYDFPALRRETWDGRLLFGSSETASRCGGYLEGALEAARRIEQVLLRWLPQRDQQPAPVPTRQASSAGKPRPLGINATSLQKFSHWTQAQQEPAFEGYRRLINASLAVQQREQLTQRAVLAIMEGIFSSALLELEALPFDSGCMAVEHGCSALTPHVQSAFHGFIDHLMTDVVRFNRTSCALSNFPHEHVLSKEYEQTLLRDVAAAWREFSLAANSILLAKRTPVDQHQHLGVTS